MKAIDYQLIMKFIGFFHIARHGEKPIGEQLFFLIKKTTALQKNLSTRILSEAKNGLFNLPTPQPLFAAAKNA